MQTVRELHRAEPRASCHETSRCLAWPPASAEGLELSCHVARVESVKRAQSVRTDRRHDDHGGDQAAAQVPPHLAGGDDVHHIQVQADGHG